ncbi:MAG: sugar phosphate isomerase/epimerase family protein [Geminicoccaceae bacterium]
MNPLGVHALVFVSGWSQKEAARAIDRAQASGYQYLEIPLIDPKAINVKRTRKALESAGIKPITSLGLSMETDISSDDPAAVSRGETHLNNALTVARDLGSTMLSGVIYSALGKYQKASTDIGRWNCVQALRRLAERAKASDMTIGIEPVNRYESNLINSGDDALSLIEAVGADNMVVHLDSYHMNIEEGAPGPLIERLGKRLGYVHVNESHRGYLGTGSIDFHGLFQALADHDYDGVITFEAFSAGLGDPKLNAELAVWRPLFDDPDELARHARNFMIEAMQRVKQRPSNKIEEARTQAESRGPTPAHDPEPREGNDGRNFGWSRRPA